MFTIVISEKGGAERRESFDKNEINVGRVQGNDLVLPKGNVSKHHARLLFRDARFIVTDLKSTNGTYVNGRKITQATIVREGDKIYIGDFVVRLDAGSGAQLPPDEPSYRTADEESHDAGKLPVPREPAPGQPVPQQQAFGQSFGQPQAPGAKGAERVSHYPLERDPDDSDGAPAEPPGAMKVPAAPRVPGALGPAQPVGGDAAPRVPRTTALLGDRPLLRPTGAGASVQPRAATGGATPGGAPVSVRGVAPPAVPPPGQATAMLASQAQAMRPAVAAPHGAKPARRDATAKLIQRVTNALGADRFAGDDAFDEEQRAEIDRTVREHAKRLRDSAEFPDAVEADVVARDALAELTALGPLESLIDDPDVSEICAVGLEPVTVVRGRGFLRGDIGFSTSATLDRAIRRLAVRAGEPVAPDETLIERTLRGDLRLSAILGAGGAPGAITLKRSQRVEASVEELIRLGAMSRPIATFLESVLSAGGRALVVGNTGTGASSLAAAFARALDPSRPAMLVQGGADIGAASPSIPAVSFAGNDARDSALLRMVASMSLDQVIVDRLRPALASGLLEATHASSAGFLVTMQASSLRRAFAAFALHASRGAPRIECAEEAVASAFDMAIEIADLGEAKWRVLRVAELGEVESGKITVRDIFTGSADAAAAGDAAFVATGVTPKVVGELATRGVRIDPNLFRRGR